MFIIWVVLNGRITVEIVCVGLAVSALIYLFICKFMGYSPRAELRALKKLHRAVYYLGFVFMEVLKANIPVMKLILNPELEVQPKLVRFKTRLKGDAAKAALANSITLTPGTITVLIEDDEYMVHCLDETLSEGLEDSEFERRLLIIEGGERDDG